MLKLQQDAPSGSLPDAALTLPFDQRKKSRLRARMDSGEEVALMLQRGRVLRDGDLLQLQDGRVVRIHAAVESVSTVRTGDPTTLARGAYHLGNRHVPLEVAEGYLRYQHDHVLDAMVRSLGLEVITEQAPFEPESGAYGGGHSHGDDGDHGHSHSHGTGHRHD